MSKRRAALEDRRRLDPRCQSTEATMQNLFSRFVRDESGATAIEYGLIATLIALAIIAAVTATGNALKLTFSSVSAGLTPAA